jgi:glyoxylase-like metal-dependent hydrolase (beta-lactamase superfamily II)
VPALKTAGAPIAKIDCLILTHDHGDHAGGKTRILWHNPDVKLVDGTCDLSAYGLTVYEMKGHTLDCIGVFDEKSGTLLSGDGLQGAGVGKYRAYAQSCQEYLKTIGKVKLDKAVKNLLFSHAYEPWNRPRALGREEVEAFLQACENYAKKNMEI